SRRVTRGHRALAAWGEKGLQSGRRCDFPHKPRPWATGAAVLAMVFGAAPAVPSKEPQASGPAFKRDILPIFERNCLRCHGMKVKKGGLNLSTSEAVLVGGEAGPAVVPKHPAASKR